MKIWVWYQAGEKKKMVSKEKDQEKENNCSFAKNTQPGWTMRVA